jgi:hypothetical protein
MTEFITKDSGARQEYASGMHRDLQDGKPDFYLCLAANMPYSEQLLTRWAALMERGAKKYSISTETVSLSKLIAKLREELICQHAYNVKFQQFTRKENAEVVMNADSEQTIQNLLNAREKIVWTGVDEIRRELENSPISEKLTEGQDRETKKQSVNASYANLDSPGTRRVYYWKNRKISAESATFLYDSAPSIWTMTISLDLPEVTYVMGATEDSVCWETILRVLQEHYGIYKNLQLRNMSTRHYFELITKSNRNWEMACGQEELERFKASAFRHMMQWLCNETDEDHASAVLFNINAAEYVKWKLNSKT